MIEIETLEEVETEAYEDHEIYNFGSEEYSWEEVYELGVELQADVIGKKADLDGEVSSYFVSLSY